jgi:uncharacterized membrane protein
MVRTLQFRAYRSLQFGATIMDITAVGERLLRVLYTDELPAEDPPRRPGLPPLRAQVIWPNGYCQLRQVDLPKLVAMASSAGAVAELRVAIGSELRRDQVVANIHGGHRSIGDGDLLSLLDVGVDRSFDQDPLFAFRLLVDIALRALSTAINDPITSVQATAGVHALLHTIVDRDLDIGRIGDAHGEVRVILPVPTWDDYLAIGIDELTPYLGPFPQARTRLVQMVDDLIAEAPPARREALEARRAALTPG